MPFTLKKAAPALLLVAFATMSILWAEEPVIAARRATAFVGTTIFALYLAVRYDARQVIRITAHAMMTAIILSFLFVLVLPELAVHVGDKHDGMWRGVFQQKNLLGRWMSLSAILFFIYRHYSKRRAVAWIWLGLSVVMIWRSQSATAAISISLLFMLVPAARLIRKHAYLVIGIFGLLLAASTIGAVVLLDMGPDLLLAIGKDATLTGRTTLWLASFQSVMDRPWLGHGYGSFWLGYGSPGANVWTAAGWTPATGHNSFIDLLLELGAIGTSIFVVSLILCVRRTVQCLRGRNRIAGEWYAMFLAFVVIVSVTHTIIPVQNSLIWVWYVVMMVHSTVVETEFSGKYCTSEEITEEMRAVQPVASI